MIPIAKPLIGKEEVKLVVEALKSRSIAQGPKVKEFEGKFAEYIGVKRAVAVNSGTAALHVALLAHGVKPGDEVIVPSFTFIATANSVLYCNAKPVFADVDDDSFNIDVEDVKRKITSKTKAVIPVHLYGQPADMKELMEISREKNIAVIEDACQSHGAAYEGKKVGGFGIGCFSFYPTKNMATGEGGMLTTDDDRIAELCEVIRSHGSRKRYYHEMLGFNYRMTDINAAIGLAQLEKLPDFNKRRVENANYLSKKLGKVKGVVVPKTLENRTHVYHQYTVKITEEFGKTRDEVVAKLNEKGVGTGIYYPLPIHQQDLYKQMGYNVSLPVTERVCKQVISLPCHPAVKKKDLTFIVKSLKEIKNA
ncbi:MAG: DegT/DnrJ/EryC1/StrS family aminotransferase [Candidatus Altiarchaeales archaeon]|nr:DegT/DnrJ/EryC1/StrS family aminotransferase [Candidatus Altiarchaeales archaeon]